MASKTVPVSVWEEGVTYPKTQWEFVRYSQYAGGTPTMAEIRQLTVRVRCDQLVPNDRPVRKLITEDQIARMAKSVKSEGVETPLWVYQLDDGRFRVFDGDVRLLGALRCDAEGTLPEGTVPVHVYPFEDFIWLCGQANNVASDQTSAVMLHLASDDEVRVVDGNMRMRAAIGLGMSIPVQLEGVGQGLVSKEGDGVVRAVFAGGRRMRVAGF